MLPQANKWSRSNTTQGQIDKARDDRIAALEKELAESEARWRRDNEALIDANRENAKLRDLLTRTYNTYSRMTSAAFSIGLDRNIRAEVEKFLGLEEA